MVNLKSPYPKSVGLFNDPQPQHPPLYRKQIKFKQISHFLYFFFQAFPPGRGILFIIFPFPTAGRCIDLFGRQCYLRRNIVLHLEYDLKQSDKQKDPYKSLVSNHKYRSPL